MQISKDLVKLSSEAGVALDGRLRVTAWNRAAEALLGYSEDDVRERPCWQVLQATTPEGLAICSPRCAIGKCFYNGVPFSEQELLCQHKDGREVRVSLSTLVVPSGQSDDGTIGLVFLHSPAPMPNDSPGQLLRLYSLGGFRLFLGDAQIDHNSWRRKQSLVLLKYLIVNRGRPVHREKLVEALWPDVPLATGLSRLKVVVYFLRCHLGSGKGDHYLLTEGESYRLDRERLWLDVDSFEGLIDQGTSLARRGEAKAALRCYEAAVALYEGPFLSDELYSDWAAEERERLTERYLSVLSQSGSLYTHSGDLDRAVSTYRLALQVEPCREDIHRALMKVLWEAGRRDEAILQYRACQRVLAKELDVAPLPETTELFAAILKQPVPASAP